MHRWVVLFVALVALFGRPTPTAGHAQLAMSSPPADALLAAPPAEVVLTFTEPVDASAMTVTLVDEAGTTLASGAVAVDPADGRTVRATAGGVGFGITTVSWATRSTTDGHTLSGSFAFRVGGASRAPAATTVEGDRPAAWSVATRWGTFLGLALAVGTLVVGRSARRDRLVLAGAGIALGASLLEPLLLRLVPPEGWVTPTLAEALQAQPWAWWLRPLGALLVLVGLSPRIARRTWLTVAPGAGLCGLLGLSLTAHAAGRESLRLPALLSVIAHNWSVALWVGGLLLIVMAAREGWARDLGGFSRRALPIASVAIATGLVNAGFLYPSVERLQAIRETDYGWVLIAKVIVVAAILAMAGLHLLLLRAGEGRWGVFRVSLPAEAVALAVVLVAASTMAMLAPPGAADEDLPEGVVLSLPVTAGVNDDQLFVRLAVEPAPERQRRLSVSTTDGPPVSTVANATGGYEQVSAPVRADLQAVRVTLRSLSTDIAPTTLDLATDGAGLFVRDGFVVASAGWWEAQVTVRIAGQADQTVTGYLLEPDPNLVGFDEVPTMEDDPAAVAIQVEARARLDQRTSYSYVELLNGGNGGVEVIELSYSDNRAGDGRPGVAAGSSAFRMVRLDGRRYTRSGDGDWVETDDSPVLSPAEVATDYDGAEQVRLAGEELIAGERCRRVSFHVPATSTAAAWYVWWVSVETGEVRQEAMVSRSHYMVKRYTAVNEPLVIAAPA